MLRYFTMPTLGKLLQVRVVVPLILCLIIILMFVIHPRHDTTAYSQVPATAIPYARLASEGEYPFLKFGDVPSSEHLHPPLYKKYRKAVEKFPDARSCLVRSERIKEHPNLLMFNWDAIHSFEEGEVCLFRIFASIGDLENVKSWLTYQGLRVTDHYERPASKYAKSIYAEQRWNTVVASWPSQEKGTIFYTNVAEKLSRELLEHGVSVGVTAAENGEVVDINVTAITL